MVRPILLCLLLPTACAYEFEAGALANPEAYVLLSENAREQKLEVWTSHDGVGVLPEPLDSTLEVHVLDEAGGARTYRGASTSVLVIDVDSEPEVFAFADDVDPDALEVRGTDDAIFALRGRTGAEIVFIDNDVAEFRLPNIYAAASELNDIDGIESVVPVRLQSRKRAAGSGALGQPLLEHLLLPATQGTSPHFGPAESDQDASATAVPPGCERLAPEALEFEAFLDALSRCGEGSLLDRVRPYIGQKVRWRMRNLGDEMSGGFRPDSPIGPNNWDTRFRLKAASLPAHADLGAVYDSAYPIVVSGVTRRSLGADQYGRAPVLVTGTISGVDRYDSIFLRDFAVSSVIEFRCVQ